LLSVELCEVRLEIGELHAEHAHRAEDLRQLVAHELLAQLRDDALLCVGGHEVTEATLVLDDFAIEQRLVTLGHGVWIDSDSDGELAHRRDALAFVPLAGQDAIAHLLRDLLVDPFRLAKFHGSPASRWRATTRRTS